MPLTRTQLIAVLGGLLLLAIILTLLLRPRPTPHDATIPPACTHWAKPTGTGSTCTQSAPCTVQAWTQSKALAGAVLCLQDGTYDQASGRIAIPATVQGTAASRVWLRAEHAGKVLLTGNDSGRPIDVQGAYVALWGLNACCGDNYVVSLRGSYGWAKDLVAWNAGRDGDAGFRMSGDNNLAEDVAWFGSARYPISATQPAGGGNSYRRVWARWEANEHPTSNPSATAILGYTQDNLLFENLVLTWSRSGLGKNPQAEGLGSLFATVNSQWLGSILYVSPEAVSPPSLVMSASVDGGSHSQDGSFHPTTGFLFRHILAYFAPSHAAFATSQAFRFQACQEPQLGCLPGSSNVLDKLTGIATVPSSFSNDWRVSNLQEGPSLDAAVGSGKSVWTDSHAGPGICKRYVGGVLTEQGLWPWPMNARIQDAMTQAGVPPVDVTAQMEQLFGVIPQQCRTDSTTPIPPEPTPPPGAGPHPTLACVGRIAAVPGDVALTCTPQAGGRR